MVKKSCKKLHWPFLFMVLWCAESTRESCVDAATSQSPLAYWTSLRLKSCGKKLLGGCLFQTNNPDGVSTTRCNLVDTTARGTKRNTIAADEEHHLNDGVVQTSVEVGEQSNDFVDARTDHNVDLHTVPSVLMNHEGDAMDPTSIQVGEKLFDGGSTRNSQMIH